MINFLKQLLDYLYKKKCYICSKTYENTILCSKCKSEIDKNEKNYSYNINISDGIAYYHAGYYVKNLQKIIRGLKYHNQKELAIYLAEMMYEFWQKFEVSKQAFTVIPVPLYLKREKKRHYNHMELIAVEFCRLSGYKLNTQLIKRIKDTQPQYGLSVNERVKNLENAFAVNKDAYNTENILLLDDILTTGATMREMIKTFRSSEINKLTVFTTTATISHK